MTVSKIGAPPTTPLPLAAEAKEPKGPDLKKDHDGDDAAASPAATLPPGQGARVDTKA
jgi:hypothetical protein